MTQYQLLLTQNIHASLTEWAERLVDGTRGGIITFGSGSIPTTLSPGTSGYVLYSAGNGADLYWGAVDNHVQNTDTGTTSNSFSIGSGNNDGKFVLSSTSGGGDFKTTLEIVTPTADTKWVLRNVDDYVLGENSSAVISNKSLSDSTTFFVDVTDDTKKLKIDVTGTTGITGTLQSAFTTARTVTLPDASDTLVGTATTDTLTNKTYDTAAVGNIFKINTNQINAYTGTGSTVVLSTNPIITGPTIDDIKTSGVAVSADLWSEITTGSIAIGAGLTTGTLNIDSVSTGTHIVNIAAGNTSSGEVKTVNIGTGGVSGSTVNVSIGGANAGSTVTVNRDLVVTGDLTVNGTTTTINATTLNVDDKNIELGAVASPSDATAEGGGISLKGTTDKTITWLTASGWTFSEDVSIASGKVFKVNGTTVLTSTAVLGITGTNIVTKSGTESITGAKTFDKDAILMKGTNTGTTTISTANTSATSYTATLQAATGTIAYLSDITAAALAKASYTDIDTGTDDTKYVTSLGLRQSKILRKKASAPAYNDDVAASDMNSVYFDGNYIYVPRVIGTAGSGRWGRTAVASIWVS